MWTDSSGFLPVLLTPPYNLSCSIYFMHEECQRIACVCIFRFHADSFLLSAILACYMVSSTIQAHMTIRVLNHAQCRCYLVNVVFSNTRTEITRKNLEIRRLQACRLKTIQAHMHNNLHKSTMTQVCLHWLFL